MSFNIIDVLRDGKTEYLNYLRNLNDNTFAIDAIRKSSYKMEILHKCQVHFNKYPIFWLRVMYDTNEYFKLALFYREKYNYKFEIKDYENILMNVDNGIYYILEKLEEIIDKDNNFAKCLVEYSLKSKCKDYWLSYFIYHSNFHLRMLVASYIINNYKEFVSIYYNDINKIFTNEVGEPNSQISLFNNFMSSDDASKIIALLFENNYNNIFYQAKEFLFKNYSYNNLAYYLKKIKNNELYDKVDNEIRNDINRYFKTNYKNKYILFREYKNIINKELLEKYKLYLQLFLEIKKGYKYYSESIIDSYYRNDLGFKLESYIKKYLELSTNKSFEYIGKGSTSIVIRVGDYVLKLVQTKWSYEDIICPNLYLIVKNLEEKYIRDKNGIVLIGLEVQPYLKKTCKNIDFKYIQLFTSELLKLGYFTTDSLINGTMGDNVRLLNSYLDADTTNFDEIPKWFKKYPVVLIDRDRVYKNIKNEFGFKRIIKQVPEYLD